MLAFGVRDDGGFVYVFLEGNRLKRAQNARPMEALARRAPVAVEVLLEILGLGDMDWHGGVARGKTAVVCSWTRHEVVHGRRFGTSC